MFTCPRPLLAAQIMSAYCSKKGLAMDSVRFVIAGIRIGPDYTPSDLEMEDGDIINAIMERAGD